MPKNWNRRFKHNRDKMKTGDIFELAEVVRNLSLRDHEKGLSTGEKQMFVKAKKILACELMYAKAIDEEEAAVWLDDVLAGNGEKPAKKKAKAKAAARDRVATRSRRDMSVWAVLVAAGGGRAARRGPAQGVRALGELPLLAEPLRRLDESELDRRDRRRRPAGLGGAGDPARRGARRDEGRRGRHRRGDAGRSVAAALAEVPEDALVVLVHDAARPLVSDAVIERVLAPLAEGWDGVVPGAAGHGHGQAVAGDGVVETLAREELVAVQTPQAFVAAVAARGLCGRPGGPPTARRSSRRAAAACKCRRRATRGC